ncbi:reverse transcriptase family protein [Flavobacterium branchiarum]|uniref:RNA-directed DNA polymerase n=1 Tax=Flavobacterium branchiarum TaxID=1114870 RepID=A0ABV5FJU0_9FLAO|nr:reverse transcriptase family protein [Flavobacterium branchiarum]MDN3675086.1 reverse transcriptase family protein [Flavobacterium branchiarum]
MSFPLEDFIDQAKKQNKSDEYIAVCIQYINSLSEKGYPVFFSIEHLAKEINIQSYFLRALIGESFDKYSQEAYKYQRYSYFKLKKRNGTFREIMSPSRDLKYIQKWILFNILSCYPLQDSCKGFRKNISIFDNAKVHEKSEVILKIDLLKFYDTITEKRIYGVFKNMGYIENLSYSLAKITTAKHRDSYWESFDSISKEILSDLIVLKPSILPQGAPSSPMLANIVATKMDIRFQSLGAKMNFNYSRYADDLTFSIQTGGKLPSLKLIREIITDEGFYVNNEKLKYMKKGCSQYVTGLTTTNGVNVSKKYRKAISSHIYYCRKHGVNNHLEVNAIDFPDYNSLKFHDWLYGHLCFIKSINSKANSRLLEDFNKINWFV